MGDPKLYRVHFGYCKMKKKIAILINLPTPLNPDISGGLERVALYEMKGLNDLKYDVTLYAASVIGSHRRVKPLTLPLIESISAYLKKTKLKPLLFIYEYWIKSTIFYLLTIKHDLLLCMNAEVINILSPHRSFIHIQIPVDTNFVKLRIAFALFARRFKRTVFLFCSQAILNQYADRYPWIRQRAVVLYNAVDIHLFKPDSQKQTNSPTRFLFAGNWVKAKGIDVLLEAVDGLYQKRRDFEVYLAGSPYVWNNTRVTASKKSMAEQVMATADQLPCLKIIGDVAHDRLPSVYASMDVFICPSVWEEPFGMVNVEAMSCGLPVIGTRVGGIPEIIVHGKTGLLVEKSNPDELADAMQYYLDYPEQIGIMGRAARKRVEDNFSWEIHTQNLNHIINDVKK